MSESTLYSVNSLGTVNLLRELDYALDTLTKLTAAVTEAEATELQEQLKDLLDVTNSLDSLATRERRNPSDHLRSLLPGDLVHLYSIYSYTAAVTEQSTQTIETLEHSLRKISHDRVELASYPTLQTRVDDQSWYDETYQELKLSTEVLRILLSAINLLHHKNDTDGEGQLSPAAQSFASRLHYQIAWTDSSLHTADRRRVAPLQAAVAAAKNVLIYVPGFKNKHFLAPSPRPFYSGRTTELASIRAAFEHPIGQGTTSLNQQRFVIFGLSGSGKTELALRYAQLYKDDFWGVFFVDGSSRETADAKYIEIASVAGVEPSERAVKNWLAERALPWLLIIDNVDDEEMPVRELLPRGTKGSIIITSRNPAHKIWGTVGKRFLDLLPMEQDEANELVLRAAEEPSPWTTSLLAHATKISHALGYLPLALVHAGTAILGGLCTWSDYLGFYTRHTDQIRRKRFSRSERSQSRSGLRSRSQRDDDSMNVFSTYEILYQSLELGQEEKFRDAVELLHVFSYLHFQHIHFDMLKYAATNPGDEAERRAEDAKKQAAIQEKLSRTRSGTWAMRIRELQFGIKLYLQGQLPLPVVLRNSSGLTRSEFEDDVDIRLRKALGVLVQRSLITRQAWQDNFEGRYSMHPLVHEWVRERPEMSTSQQSLWCQIATTTLAKSIARPPLGDTQKEMRLRRELVTHIDHVREHQKGIQEKLKENRARGQPWWHAIFSWTQVDAFGTLQADASARFSRVYSECGRFEDAKALLGRTRDFITHMLGEDHPVSIEVTLALSGSLWQMSRPKDAIKLQRRARSLAVETLGEDHPLSLKVSEFLGQALYLQGSWSEAQALHVKDIALLTKLYGSDDMQTLKAVRNLARVQWRFLNYKDAEENYTKAWEGIRKQRQETDLEALESLEDLAMSYLRYTDDDDAEEGRKHLPQSLERMTFVYERRKEQLGKEDNFTLLALLHLCRLKSALGRHDEAEKRMREGLTIGIRNVGEEHSAILAAKAHYARVLVELGRFSEAEQMLTRLSQKSLYQNMSLEDGDCPDRISCLWFLVGCLERQNEYARALDICRELLVTTRHVNGGLGGRHKFVQLLENKIAQLGARVTAASGAVECEASA